MRCRTKIARFRTGEGKIGADPVIANVLDAVALKAAT
jgi:hypothetical protein